MLADALFSEPLHVRLSGGLSRTSDSVNATLDSRENEWRLC
jgi:hypothetical protein